MTITQENVKALKLWQAAEGKNLHGHESRERAQLALAESVASGEFPTQILPAVRKTLTTVYDETEVVTPQFTTRKTVEAIGVDEKVEVFEFDDQENIPGQNAGDTFISGGLPTILPREKYPQIGFSATDKSIRARKIGEAFGLDWEAVVRSRGAKVNLIREAFTAFGRHAKNQEEIDVAKLLVTSSGFNTTALTGALAVPSSPDLNTDPDTLGDVIDTLLQRPVQGVLPNYTSYSLLVAPGNARAARQALATRRVRNVPARTGSGSENRGKEWEEQVVLGADVNVVVFPWLAKIWSSIGKGWILVPNPAAGDLPVLTSNYLEGYEAPSVWVKDSNARTVGGSAVNSLVDGDFDSDAVETKVRHVHGANALWVAGIAYSDGTNT